MHAIYELKDMLLKELEEYGQKDQLDVGGLDIVDKLAHTIKNLDKIIICYEEDGDMSFDGYGTYRSSRRGMNYRNGIGSYKNGSYARRGGNSNGRYSRDGGMIEELKELMEDAPDDRTRQEFQRFISKMENM